MEAEKNNEEQPKKSYGKLMDGFIDKLERADVKITFSRWCSSGALGEKCNCSRCRKGRGQEVTPESEKLSKIESIIYRYKISCPYGDEFQKAIDKIIEQIEREDKDE